MKKALIIVDMQNDFISGSLGTDAAISIVDKVKNKIDEYTKAGWEIIFTQDTHAKDYLETQEGCILPVEHCIINTNGWEICDELQVYSNEIDAWEKDTFGCKDLAEYLRCVHMTEDNYEEIELIGLCTDICIISNALLIKSFLPEVEIIVDADCCAGTSVENHQNALQAMKCCQITVIKGEEND